VRFFFDNNLSTKLAKSLHVLVEPEHQVVHLKDRFAANTPDETWMAVLARESGWIIISGDLQIRKNPHEVQAWRAAGHTTFFLKSGWINYSFWVQAYKFVKCFPDIIAAAAKAKRGEFFFVSVNGKIS
jgi:PIN like domain